MASSRLSGVFGFFSTDINHFDKWLFHEIELLIIMQAPLVYLETNGWKCLQCIVIHLTIVSRAEPGCWVMSHELCWADLEVRMMRQSQIPPMIERMLGSSSLKVKQQTGILMGSLSLNGGGDLFGGCSWKTVATLSRTWHSCAVRLTWWEVSSVICTLMAVKPKLPRCFP